MPCLDSLMVTSGIIRNTGYRKEKFLEAEKDAKSHAAHLTEGERRVVGKGRRRAGLRAAAASAMEPPPSRKARRKGWQCRGWAKKKSHTTAVATRPPGRPPKPLGAASFKMSRAELCAAAWSEDYRPHLTLELEAYAETGLLARACEFLETAPASTYLLQARATAAAAKKRWDRETLILMNWCAQAAHSRNQLTIPFSMFVRSIHRLAHKSGTRQCA